jgi:hypothetical protein
MKSTKTRRAEHVARKEERKMRENAYIFWERIYVGRYLPIFTLRRLCGFSLILNDAFSDDGLKRRPKLVNIANC